MLSEKRKAASLHARIIFPSLVEMRTRILQIRRVHIEMRLKQLGIALPPQPVPKGNYINFVRTGNLVYIAGSLPQPADGPLMLGRLGENMTVEEGKHAARLAGLNMLATLQIACNGDLDRVTRVVKVNRLLIPFAFAYALMACVLMLASNASYDLNREPFIPYLPHSCPYKASSSSSSFSFTWLIFSFIS